MQWTVIRIWMFCLNQIYSCLLNNWFFELITIIIFIEIVGMLAFLFHCVALIQDHRLNSSSSSNGLSHQYEDCSGPWEIILIVVHRWRKSFGRLDRQSDQGLPPPAHRTGECQTLSVTFTLRTSLKDVRGHSNRTSGDIPTGCPAMFYFCIFTWYLCPLCIYMNS